MQGLGSTSHKNITLIAGGEGKGADFSDLKKPVSDFVRTVYLFGKDADNIATALSSDTEIKRFETLDEIIHDISSTVKEGDVVLFSPACASLDMYKNYEARGEHFVNLVAAL